MTECFWLEQERIRLYPVRSWEDFKFQITGPLSCNCSWDGYPFPGLHRSEVLRCFGDKAIQLRCLLGRFGNQNRRNFPNSAGPEKPPGGIRRSLRRNRLSCFALSSDKNRRNNFYIRGQGIAIARAPCFLAVVMNSHETKVTFCAIKEEARNWINSKNIYCKKIR